MQAKPLDTQEHFPDLHALVGLVQPHLIRLSSSPGARRVPSGILVGVMGEGGACHMRPAMVRWFEVRMVGIGSM